MTADEARRALDRVAGAPAGRAARIEGGWAYHTFAVEPDAIFRFPRSDAVAESLEREMRLLPELARHVSFPVPAFAWRGEHAGRPFAGYPRLEGRPLRARDLEGEPARRLGSALAELHRFPLGLARELLGASGTLEAWSSEYQGLERRFARRATASLAPELRAAVASGFARFLAHELRALPAPALVHRDLGPEHILVDPGTAELRGILDWEDAAIGDPAIDFAGLWLGAGEVGARAVLRHWGARPDQAFEARIAFYAWVSALHELDYGLEFERPEIVAAALRALPARLLRAGCLS